MSGNANLTCTTCGKAFAAPAGREALGLVEEESARCARLREIAEQRNALDVARTQAGFAGVLHGSGETETVDLVMQRASISRLDAALENEAQALATEMLHVPEGPA